VLRRPKLSPPLLGIIFKAGARASFVSTGMNGGTKASMHAISCFPLYCMTQFSMAMSSAVHACIARLDLKPCFAC
jgi:hypothetical protein